MTTGRQLHYLSEWRRQIERPNSARMARAVERLTEGNPQEALATLESLPDSAALSGLVRMTRAEALLRSGEQAAAATELLAAAESDDQLPAFVWPHLARGFTEAAASAPVGADERLAELLDDAIEAAPDEPELYVARGELCRAHGHLESATNEFSYAAELDEDCSEAWIGRADCELALERAADAARSLDRAVDLEPNHIGLFVRLGQAWLQAGEPSRAAYAFEEGLELAASEPELYAGRAKAALALHLFDDALEDAQTLVELNPDDAAAWLLLARCQYELAHDKDAILSADRCMALEADHAAALKLRGDAHFNLGELDAAESDYQRALELEPANAAAHLSLTEVHLDRGDPDRAAESAQAALELDPDVARAHVLLARAHAAAGNRPAAISALREGIEQTPNSPVLYAARAELLLAAGRPYLAWRDLRWALDVDPEYAPAYVRRAQLALTMEGPDEALADLEAALELDPEDAEALAWRGRALQLAGDPESAEHDWATAESLLAADDRLRADIWVWRSER